MSMPGVDSGKNSICTMWSGIESGVIFFSQWKSRWYKALVFFNYASWLKKSVTLKNIFINLEWFMDLWMPWYTFPSWLNKLFQQWRIHTIIFNRRAESNLFSRTDWFQCASNYSKGFAKNSLLIPQLGSLDFLGTYLYHMNIIC